MKGNTPGPSAAIHMDQKVTVAKRIEMIAPERLASMFKVKGNIHDDGDGCRVKVVQSEGDGQDYVVKVQMKTRIRGSSQALFRHMTERLMNLPDSPHIVKVYACYEDEDYFYTLLEACHGGDLFDFFQALRVERARAEDADTPPDPVAFEQKVRAVITEILKALSCLHSQGIVHKDVKLENLVFKEKSRVVPGSASPKRKKDAGPRMLKLIDFDFTEEWEPRSPSSKVVGTDGYIAPEAYLGDVGPKCDLFAVGVVMYLLVEGRFPYAKAIFNDGADQNYVGSTKMQEIYDTLTGHTVCYGRVWDPHSEAKDFCKGLLEFHADKRPDAAEALKHPWIVAGEEAAEKTAKALRHAQNAKQQQRHDKQQLRSHLSGMIDSADEIQS